MPYESFPNPKPGFERVPFPHPLVSFWDLVTPMHPTLEQRREMVQADADRAERLAELRRLGHAL